MPPFGSYTNNGRYNCDLCEESIDEDIFRCYCDDLQPGTRIYCENCFTFETRTINDDYCCKLCLPRYLNDKLVNSDIPYPDGRKIKRAKVIIENLTNPCLDHTEEFSLITQQELDDVLKVDK